MWSKIYLGVLGLSLIVMAFFTYYSWSWLQSIGSPQSAIENYSYHAGTAWPVLWIASSTLLIIANAVLWATTRSWAMWVTLIFFALNVIVKFFWLDRLATSFQTSNGLASASLSLGPLVAVILIAVTAVIVFFDYFFIVRLYQRMFPLTAAAPASELTEKDLDVEPVP